MSLINQSDAFVALVLGILGFLSFYSSIDGDFVFDDTEAIINNKDLNLDTPVEELFRHDFWGTYVTHNASHKSYRPLTVLSFRFHVWWNKGKLDPFHFHLLNLLLHGVATSLSYPVFGKLFNIENLWLSKAFVAALLFAVHPIHTETVAGVVGRADLLCTIFSFLSFLVYCNSLKSDSPIKTITTMTFSGALAGVGMLCKEQGITIIGVCCIYDLLIVTRTHPFDFLSNLNLIKINLHSSKISSYNRTSMSLTTFAKKHQLVLVRHIMLLLAGSLLLYFRCWIMNFTQPVFREIDNPHSFAESFIERVLNYNYLYALNAWLLLCPEWLCFDWSMGCIPLITINTGFNDIRLLAIIFFWTVFISVTATNLTFPFTAEKREVLLALSCIVVPFSVASNVLFRVGFVIAERILYLPSVGYCMLIAIGIQQLKAHFKNTSLINVFLMFLLITNTFRCHQRAVEWRNEKDLFTSGLRVCPLNAKVHYNFAKHSSNPSIAIKHYRRAISLYPDYEQAMNNLANVLRENGNITESESLLRKAILIRPDFAAAWMNLGIVLANTNRYDEALECYNYALTYRKNYPDCYYNLGNLFLSQKLYNEAFIAWKQATSLKPTHSIAWNNMIVMLDSIGEFDKAQSLATEALMYLPNDSALHFNLANTLGKKGYYENAEQHFLTAINLKKNEALYHTNLGVLYHRWKKYHQAENEYMKALKLNPNLKNVDQNLKTVRKFIFKQKQ